MSFIVLIFFSISYSAANDFIRDALNNINQTADPCDDFYRHACPPGRFESLIMFKYQPEIKKLMSAQKERIWENLELTKSLENIKIGETDFSNYVYDAFYNLCETQNPLKSQYLQMIEDITCPNKLCFSQFSNDSNCTRVTEILQSRLPMFQNSEYFLTYLSTQINRLRFRIQSVSFILDGDYRKGVDFVKSLVYDTTTLLVDWISETPWVNNAGVKDVLHSLTQSLYLEDNYAMDIRDNIDKLMKLEQYFIKCADMFQKELDIFCLIVLSQFTEVENIVSPFEVLHNAYNSHPMTAFGVPYYAIASGDDEMAGLLGSVGVTVGHEMSHSLIENPDKRKLLPIFSREAIECIQKQYNNTCNEFREIDCSTNDKQMGDNGADVLGLQLAYQLFENYYENRTRDIYLSLVNRNVTNEQLFFYGTAISLCQGLQIMQMKGDDHAAPNVRVNSIAQHPGFQEAFQCGPTSRMMSTVEKQCLVYGKNAPEHRRKKFQHN